MAKISARGAYKTASVKKTVTLEAEKYSTITEEILHLILTSDGRILRKIDLRRSGESRTSPGSYSIVGKLKAKEGVTEHAFAVFESYAQKRGYDITQIERFNKYGKIS